MKTKIPRDLQMRNEIHEKFEGKFPLPELNESAAMVMSSTHTWRGPNPKYILIYPKERMLAAYLKMLKSKKTVTTKYRPQFLSIQVNNEKRLIEQELITKDSDGYFYGTTLLDSAYDVTWHWFKWRNRDDPSYFDPNFELQYVYQKPRYMHSGAIDIVDRPWTALKKISHDLALRQEFYFPDPVAPIKPAGLIMKELKVRSLEVISDKYFIKVREERAIMSHLYKVYSNSDRRVVIPIAYLPHGEFSVDNLIKDQFVEMKTDLDITGLVMTLRGKRAYELTYYHMLQTMQITKF